MPTLTGLYQISANFVCGAGEPESISFGHWNPSNSGPAVAAFDRISGTVTNSNNTATYTLLNAAGCDSIITLNLTLNQNPVGTDFSVNQSLFTTTPFIAQFTNK